MSSPTVNVVWALFNLVIGYTLFTAASLASGDRVTLLVFFAGIAAISIMGSLSLTKKYGK